MNQYWSTKRAVLVHITHRQSNPSHPYIRSLLRVGIKVMDEWQISLGYVRGFNIYVRGYLDLRAWSLRLRTQTEKNHYTKVLFSSREGHFSLRWIRGILAIRRRTCVSLRIDQIYRGAGRAMPQQTKQMAGLAAIVSYIQSITHAPSPHQSPLMLCPTEV